MRTRIRLLVGLVAWAAAALCTAEDDFATLRGSELGGEPAAPRMQQFEERGDRRIRNYPMQPPTIPHKVDGYVVDLNSNRCLSCHQRRRTGESQAPMVSVTHYMDRDGNFLAEVSPRRYFCNQCHVGQSDAPPLVTNRFQDVDALIRRDAGAGN